MQAVPVTTAILQQLQAALALAGALSYGAHTPQLWPEAVADLASCIGLLLGAGHACLSRLTAGGLVTSYSGIVGGQAMLMRQFLAAAAEAGGAGQLARDHATPQALAAWLGAIVPAVQAICASDLQSGEACLCAIRAQALQIAYHRAPLTSAGCCFLLTACAADQSVKEIVLSNLGRICGHIVSSPDFAPHAAAIEQDAPLAASLVRLLAPAFQAAAIALQLPLEQRSAQHKDWSVMDASRLAVALSAESLRAGLAAHLAADGPGIGRSMLQLLQPACQLLTHLPGSPEGTAMQNLALVDGCWRVLGAVSAAALSCSASQWRQGNCSWNEAAERASRPLLQLLPQLVPLLLWREQQQEAGGSEAFVQSASIALESCRSAVQVLIWLTDMRAKAVWAGAPLGALDLPWCAAASGVLRSLPALSELVQRRGAMLRDAAQSLTPLLSLFAVGAASCTCTEAGHLVRRSSKQDPQLAQLSAAVFQLHTDCCRAAHCSSDPLLGAIPPADLIRAMSYAMLAADSLASVLAGSAPLKAMATAHCTLHTAPRRGGSSAHLAGCRSWPAARDRW